MSGGSAPSVGLQGPSDPNPGQGKKPGLVQPDIVERYQDRIGPVPRQGSRDRNGPERPGHLRSATVGDNAGPGNATRKTIPVDTQFPSKGWSRVQPVRRSGRGRRNGSQDTGPVSRRSTSGSAIRRRTSICSNATAWSNTITSTAYWAEALRAGVRHVRPSSCLGPACRDRSDFRTRSRGRPTTSPFGGDADHSWLPYTTGGDPDHPALLECTSPPMGEGSPGPGVARLRRNGENRVGYKIRSTFKGTWSPVPLLGRQLQLPVAA